MAQAALRTTCTTVTLLSTVYLKTNTYGGLTNLAAASTTRRTLSCYACNKGWNHSLGPNAYYLTTRPFASVGMAADLTYTLKTAGTVGPAITCSIREV